MPNTEPDSRAHASTSLPASEGSTCRAQRLFGQTTPCRRTSQAFQGVGQMEDVALVWGPAHQSPTPPPKWAEQPA